MSMDTTEVVRRARTAVARAIEADADHRGYGVYSRWLAAEGYNGGYRDALDDVLLALGGVTPQRHDWWQPEGKDQ